ncbi:substrate-binding domain-containing protein, partial [Mesorhizobium sp. M8A.F.Ca.ET.161.01.1.1]|uniref:substrate-binding domain-containing protein n=1 Tax=Mesorhizobium sp. M8A.F.Ca.ET.161.01.1.1 TaxID=2563959 RepID=UPI001137D95B
FVSPEQVRTALYAGTRDRLTGYFNELSRVGVDTSSVPVYETANDAASTRAALEAIFAAGEPPTAILAMSDRMALIALEWLAARNLKVPKDVSVVGFDGVPEAAACEPPLTTIAQPIAEMARLAVKA